MSKETVNVRMYKETYTRLKIRAVREGKTLMQMIEEVSKQKYDYKTSEPVGV